MILALLCLAIAPPGAAAASAAGCVDYGDYLRRTGGVVTPGQTGHVTIVDKYAYVADLREGLQVVDISRADDPEIVASVDTPDYARWVAVSGDCAFVADGVTGVVVVDVSDPESAHIVSVLDTPGEARAVAVSNKYGYVADYRNGLHVLDVSDCRAPFIVGSVDTPHEARAVDVWGDYAYVADSQAGLHIVDVSNPQSPQIVSTVPTSDWAWGVSVEEGQAAVAINRDGIMLVDVSDPLAPEVVSTLFVGDIGVGSSARDVTLRGDYAYLGAGAWGLKLIDVADFDAPRIVGSIHPPGAPQGIAIVGKRAFVTDALGLQIYDLTNPYSVPITGHLETALLTHGVDVIDGWALVASNWYGLLVVDVSDPSNPVLARSIVSAGPTWDVVARGDYAYVADREGVYVLDISDPATARVLGRVETPGVARGVALSDQPGPYLYVADYRAGIHVLEVSDPQSLRIVGTLDTPGDARDLAAAGSYVYVADGVRGGLEIVDVSVPETPEAIASIDMLAVDVDVRGSHVFVGVHTSGQVDQFEEGVVIVDVSEPAMPAIVAQVHIMDVTRGVNVFGDHLYIAGSQAGVQIVDISDPTSPKTVGMLDTPALAHRTASDGRHLYVADHIGGLLIAPAQCERVVPILIEAFAVRALDDAIAIEWSAPGWQMGDFRLAAEQGSRRWNVPINRASAGALVAIDEVALQVVGKEVSYSLYGRRPTGEWELLKQGAIIPSPRSSDRNLLSLIPNPFVVGGTLHYIVPEPGAVRLTLHDLRGQLVRVLVDGVQDSGSYQVAWDGTDDRGRPVAMGTYLCRAEIHRRQESRKLLLIE